ncbi:(2Fe-2S) ferredoxin [Chitinophaga sp. CF118]|uniref:(2Fe-2S) ferredoxin domain-containing protein n=1 Tax=Chitinophaga sp. CF118 TaxID=1884367 RepID=UPI0008E6E48A|nr:(2Fe-2S) ferredoxin domain-containing protein [Chitinophaga sp. CF118]SFD48093.1 (2Fe-2S) ferredoxin [Chitinophaga sp. CF118]
MAIKDLTKVQKIVFICNGGTCSNKSGSDDNTAELRKHLTEHDLNDEVHTIRTKCMGQCDKGPIMFIHPDGIWYGGVNLELTGEIVKQHLKENIVITESVVFPEQEVSVTKNN